MELRRNTPNVSVHISLSHYVSLNLIADVWFVNTQEETTFATITKVD